MAQPDLSTDPAHSQLPLRLEQLLAARAATLDENRPAALERQHGRGRWTARERIGALLDPGTFLEYGQLAEPKTRALGEGPADGLVMGVGLVDGRAVCVFTYDYTVFGGSQSPRNHRKMDRMLALAERNRWPVLCWSEGGGARATELDYDGGMVTTFVQLARMSGLVPIICLLSGPSFAGQANIAGCADVVIATRASTLGLSGPPLVLSATGAAVTPQDIGPMDLHERIGTVDLLVDDEEQLLATARAYLGYFGGRVPAVDAPGDADALRRMVPENPRRAYDVRRVVAAIADEGAVLELRPLWGRCLSTSLVRIDGRPLGVIANNPMFGAGAIDRDGADKFSRFVELCNAYDLPLLFLCDTPGFMIGRGAEETALVRHSARTLMALANADVPLLTIVLRKAYGLGYYVMGCDCFQPELIVGWPTAEFGGMGLEGAVNIVYRDELAAAVDESARKELRARLTEEMKERNTGLSYARGFALDDIIDPADTREVLIRALNTLPAPPPRTSRKHPIDPW